jgi:hypothetical protein
MHILRPLLTLTDILQFFSGLGLDILTEISKEVEMQADVLCK